MRVAQQLRRPGSRTTRQLKNVALRPEILKFRQDSIANQIATRSIRDHGLGILRSARPVIGKLLRQQPIETVRPRQGTHNLMVETPPTAPVASFRLDRRPTAQRFAR